VNIPWSVASNPGTAAFILLLCVYMVPTGSMKAYIQLMVSYAAMFRDSGTSYCVLLGRWKPSTPLNEMLAQIQYINSQFLNLKNTGYLFIPVTGSVCHFYREAVTDPPSVQPGDPPPGGLYGYRYQLPMVALLQHGVERDVLLHDCGRRRVEHVDQG
jgi:hypothetical protein